MEVVKIGESFNQLRSRQKVEEKRFDLGLWQGYKVQLKLKRELEHQVVVIASKAQNKESSGEDSDLTENAVEKSEISKKGCADL